MTNSFLAGNTSKSACPNLGDLLDAALVSDNGLTDPLALAVIKEAILRNVVWTFNVKPEFPYLEPSSLGRFSPLSYFTSVQNFLALPYLP